MVYVMEAYLLDILNENFVDSLDGPALLLRFRQHSIQCPRIQCRDVDASDFVSVDLVFALMAIQLVYLFEK